jgi:hypothetical protein
MSTIESPFRGKRRRRGVKSSGDDPQGVNRARSRPRLGTTRRFRSTWTAWGYFSEFPALAAAPRYGVGAGIRPELWGCSAKFSHGPLPSGLGGCMGCSTKFAVPSQALDPQHRVSHRSIVTPRPWHVVPGRCHTHPHGALEKERLSTSCAAWRSLGAKGSTWQRQLRPCGPRTPRCPSTRSCRDR